MSVGNQATVNGINQSLTSYAIQLRDLCQQLANFQQNVVKLGLPGLEALGYSPADAQTVLNMASYMNTIAGVFTGTTTQNIDFNFGDALSILYAGQ